MEESCRAEESRGTHLEVTSATQLPDNASCLACSDDGSYLSVGHSGGVSVWWVPSLVPAADWLEDRLDITSIQMTRMAEITYLLATIDDMGVARVFAYRCDNIHLLSVVNIMEDINKRTICLTFELSEGGHYGTATLSCNGAVWLEVHHFPIETWLKELETAAVTQTQKPNSGDTDMKWSPLLVATKIRPPKIPAGMTREGPHEAQITGFLMHCLSLDEDASSHHFKPDAKRSKQMKENTRRCTQHFLLPCGHSPGNNKATSQPAAAVCVWWSGSHNLLQYSLQKPPKHTADVELVPERLWPNAKEILCSAVTRCTRYIAIGLVGALVCVWDRRSGSPVSVVLMPAADSALCRMQFVDYCPVSADGVHLVVVCKSGAIHRVAAGRGEQVSTVQLIDRPKDSGDFPAITASVLFLQGTLLVVQRNGKMFLQNVINKTSACFLIPPKPYMIASPCSPVYALNNKQQTLFIRGDRVPSHRGCSEEDRQSQLLVFHFGECNILSNPDSPQRQENWRPAFHTLEDTCNLYLQQRALTVDERNKAIAHTWKQLQETAATAQKQKHGVIDS